MATNADLSLTIRAIDKISAPMRAMTAKIKILTAPFRKMGKDFDELSKAANFPGIVKGFSGVGSAVKGVASETFSLGAKLIGLAAGASYAFWTIARGAINSGDKLAEMADRVGMGVDAYASLQYAAAQADVDQEQFNNSMDQFNKRLGEAKAGGGSLLSFLNKVSPALGMQVKGAKNSEEALSLMTDAFTKLDSPQKRAALSAEAFGKSGLQMGTFLAQGRAAIQGQQVAFLNLAGSKETFARGAGNLDNVLRNTETAFIGLRDAALGALFPALAKLAEGVTNFMVKNRDGLTKWAERTGAAISAWVDSGGFSRLVTSLESVGSSIASVISWLGPMGTAMAGATVLALPLIASIGSLVASVGSLAIAAWPLIVTAIGTVSSAVTVLNASMAGLGVTWGALGLAVLPFVVALGAVAAAGKALYDNWADLKLIFSEVGDQISQFGLTSGLKSLFGGIGSEQVVGNNGEALRTINGTSANTGLTPEAQARAGLTASRPLRAQRPVSQSLTSTNDARVSIDFTNLPRGATVSSEATKQPVDLDVGYSMEPLK